MLTTIGVTEIGTFHLKYEVQIIAASQSEDLK